MNTNIKNLRKIILALMITILTGSFALAQSGGQQGPPPLPSDKQIEKMVKSLDKELELSENQETQVSELYFAHFEELETMQKQKQRASREEMNELKSEFETEVKTVLSEDQQDNYTAWLKKQEKKRSSQRPQDGRQGQGQQGGQKGPPR